MTNPQIQVSRLVKTYQVPVRGAGLRAAMQSFVRRSYDTVEAVRDINFSIEPGEIVGFIGPNGAGKTTTLRMINDIIAPDAGEIRILETLTPGAAAATKIGYLPEERGLYPKMRVIDMITFMGELRGLSAGEAKKRAGHWLDRLGLSQWAKNKVQDLSKGMQQKVQFATALIHEPEIVILDDPALVDEVALPFGSIGNIRGRLFLDLGGAWLDGQSFKFWNSDCRCLEDGKPDPGD